MNKENEEEEEEEETDKPRVTLMVIETPSTEISTLPLSLMCGLQVSQVHK